MKKMPLRGKRSVGNILFMIDKVNCVCEWIDLRALQLQIIKIAGGNGGIRIEYFAYSNNLRCDC